MTSPGKWIATLGLVLFGLALSLMLVEVVVRIFFEEPIQPRFVVDGGYGVRANQPSITTRHSVPGDYRVVINTNSAGMRDLQDYSVKKPPNVTRIAVIGDSFVFGYGVNDSEVVSEVLEKQLNNASGTRERKYEVINLSVSGFGQAEELVTYQEMVRPYKPDYVVLFYFDNDVGNNAVSRLFELHGNGGVRRTETSYLPGVKARERLYSIAPIRWLFTHSQAWNLIRNRLSSLVQRSLLRKQGMKGFSEKKPEAIELTRRLLREFIGIIQRDGAEPIVFVIPTKKIESNFPLDAAQVRQTGAAFVDGRDFLKPQDYYKRDSHWTPDGHRKAAERLAAIVTEMN